MHTRKYANAARTCDVLFANSAYTAADVTATLGVAEEQARRRAPGLGPGFAPEGDRYDVGATVRARRRDARAAKEPHRARRRLAPARRRARPRARRWGGLGRAGRARPRASSGPATSRTRAPAPLPRRRRFRLSVADGGFGIPDRRGDGMRYARRRVGASLARRGGRRGGTPSRSRRPRGACRRDPRGARAAARSSSRRASSTRRASRGVQPRTMLAALEERT